MRVLVCGSTGCVGSAVLRALRSRGHTVIEGARALEDTPRSMRIDFMRPVFPAEWMRRLAPLELDAVVNCVGILMPSGAQTFDRIHGQGPIELFEGAARAGVKRVVQVSALGVRNDAQTSATPYLRSKLQADTTLAHCGMEWAVLRPSLIYGPRSESARLFATLASLPVIGLPGTGGQPLQPIHVYELAEIVARLLEQREAPNAIHEIGGGDVVTYRQMLAAYRQQLALGDPIWLPIPASIMKVAAWLAEKLPQKVYSRDTLRMLDRGSVPADDSTPRLLGRAPTTLAQGLAFGLPRPLLDLRVTLSEPMTTALRAALAFMWIYTAAISILMQHACGVMVLLARCGFSGEAGTIALIGSCTLNIALGVATLVRPSPWVYLLQAAAIVGYTVTAAINMPELTIDHCGPLVKNLPVLMTVVVLWLASAETGQRRSADGSRRTMMAMSESASEVRFMTTGLNAPTR